MYGHAHDRLDTDVDRLDSTAAVLVSRPHPSPQPRSQGSRGVEFIRIYVIYVNGQHDRASGVARARSAVAPDVHVALRVP